MDALQALYGLSYTLKFQIKKDLELDYTVMGLEGLWWVPDMNDFTVDNKDAWLWTMMIRQPDQVTPEQFERARVDVIKKKGEGSYNQVRLERFEEGLCAQVMHIGPYAAEAPTIQALHAFIAAAGRTRRGKHHEIYLGDPRRTDPAKLRTILRQPAE
ncbi:MAG: GyrI-like domain-containing protein [Anaerolineaceae bacterium]